MLLKTRPAPKWITYREKRNLKTEIQTFLKHSYAIYSSDGKSSVSSFFIFWGFLIRAVCAALWKCTKFHVFLITGRSKKSSRTVGKSTFITCVPTSRDNLGFLNRANWSMLSNNFFLPSRGKNGQRLHGFSALYMSLYKISMFNLIRSRRSRSIKVPMEVRAEPNVAKIAPAESKLRKDVEISLNDSIE